MPAKLFPSQSSLVFLLFLNQVFLSLEFVFFAIGVVFISAQLVIERFGWFGFFWVEKWLCLVDCLSEGKMSDSGFFEQGCVRFFKCKKIFARVLVLNFNSKPRCSEKPLGLAPREALRTNRMCVKARHCRGFYQNPFCAQAFLSAFFQPLQRFLEWQNHGQQNHFLSGNRHSFLCVV